MLSRDEEKEVELVFSDKYIDLAGECFSDSDMCCPSCKYVVGDGGWEVLFYNYCPNCGQKLKYTKKED